MSTSSPDPEAGDAAESLSRTSSGKDGRKEAPDEEHHGTPARNSLSIEAEEQVVGEPPSVVAQVKLQDQTNLLPFKQLIVVFVGLSCALFCKSWSSIAALQKCLADS